MSSSNFIKGFAILAIGLVVAVALAYPSAPSEPSGSQVINNADGSVTIIDDTETITMGYGEQLLWEPTFSISGYTMTIAGSTTAMPEQTATYSTSCGSADDVQVSVKSNTKLNIKVSSDFTGTAYYLMVKGYVDDPVQTIYHGIIISIETYELSYGSDPVYATVGTAITPITPSSNSPITAVSYSIDKTLPAGMSFDTATGAISGTPTASKAQTTYTVTANYGGSTTLTAQISIGAYNPISATNYDVYAITNTTTFSGAKSIPGATVPAGTALGSVTTTVTKDGSPDNTFAAGSPYNGLTVNASTGAITGKPTSAGVYVFSQSFAATAETGGSTAARTVTLVVEDKIALPDDAVKTIYAYDNERKSLYLLDGNYNVNQTVWSRNNADSVILRISAANVGSNSSNYIYKGDGYIDGTTLTTNEQILSKYAVVGQNVYNRDAGVAKQLVDGTWTEIDLDANPTTTPTMGIALGDVIYHRDTMVIKNLPAGDYSVRMKVFSAYDITPTSSDIGTTPSANSTNPIVKIYVRSHAGFTDNDGNAVSEATFKMATNRAYTPLTLKSTLENGEFSIVSYGDGITSDNISINSRTGSVTPGSVAMTETGTYDVTVKVTDPTYNPDAAEGQDSMEYFMGNSATITLHVVVTPALEITSVKITQRAW